MQCGQVNVGDKHCALMTMIAAVMNRSLAAAKLAF